MDNERYLAPSDKILIDDIDWSEARRAGLTEDERFILTYFSDIESQTIFYLRDMLRTDAVLDSNVIGFLSVWNYEEYFHGQALSRLMTECGHPLGDSRIARVRSTSQISEALNAVGASLVSRIFRADFPAVFMSWGAVNELTTLRGYETLQDTTSNPVLKILCERIARQERRHFAWYFNNACERLERSPLARKLTRTLLRFFWSPVGAGVKTNNEVFRLIRTLFPDEKKRALADEIDQKMGTLPGLQGIRLMGPVMARVSADSRSPDTTHKFFEPSREMN